VSVRRVSLQKSASSILTSNKLARSAPKRVAVRVNGGLAGVASDTQVSGTTSANRSWRSAFIQVNGEGPAKTQDDVRASSSGRRMNAERRYDGRGTGAIRATGSYEGSLSVEGISGCHEPSPFTRRWSRRPRRLPHAGKRKRCAVMCSKAEGDAKALRHSAEEGEATEVSEARSVAGAVGR